MGTPHFAVEPLKKILEAGYTVKAVVTAPDKPAGRGQKISMSAVKEFALEKKLPVLQPDKLKEETFINRLQSLQADLFVVVAFRMLPEAVWKMPPQGTINLHASILPQYRGAAPINWALINGETQTGVSTFFIKHEIDTGDILLQEILPIDDEDDAGTLHDKLMHLGSDVLVKTIRLIETSNASAVKQENLVHEHQELKQAPKIFKSDCKLNWHDLAHHIHNKVRGLSPYPGAWTKLKNTSSEYKIYKTKAYTAEHSFEPGKIETDYKNYLKVYCKEGYIEIQEIQASGKKRMPVEEYLKRCKFSTDACFE
jgi:methionyl-tRNA formyltransferase